MSKAFTKESDDAEEPERPENTSSSQHKNYVTPYGFTQMQNELRQLYQAERPKIVETVRWAASNGDRSENGDYIYGKRRLREIDRRVRYLTKRLENSIVVDPKQQQSLTQIFFGATVTYRQKDNIDHVIKIVGIDEADATIGKISWISPIAKALIKARVGDTIEFKTPTSKEVLTIIDIRYEITAQG